MSEELKEAVHEMGFCGNYLVQKSAAANWVDDEMTQRFLMKELLRFADRIADAAKVIQTQMLAEGID